MATATMTLTLPDLTPVAVARIEESLSQSVLNAARRFADSTRHKMTDSVPSGRNYARKRGAGFRRFHRASARGERPAPDTMRLVRSTNAKRVNRWTAEAVADTPYAPILENKLARPIMSGPGDEAEALATLAREVDTALARNGL
jgi:hypothetical protein